MDKAEEEADDFVCMNVIVTVVSHGRAETRITNDLKKAFLKKK